MNGKVFFLLSVLIGSFFTETILGQDLYFERVTGFNETPSTPIHGIVKDSVGYIWFGSWNGVYRYDGKTFDEFRHNTGDAYTLPNNRIRNLILDQNKSLWLLTFDRQIVKYNYSLNQFEVVPESNVPNLVLNLLNSTPNQLNRNAILGGKSHYISSHKLVEEDPGSGETHTYVAEPDKPGGLSDAYVTSFFIDDQEILWLGTRSGDIYKANTHRKPFSLNYLQQSAYKSMGYATVRALLKAKNELWIGTNEGVEVYKNNKRIQNHAIKKLLNEDQQVRSFLKDGNENIWIGGVNGLDVYLPETQKIINIINRQFPSQLDIRSVYALEEKNESIWVGLYNGLARVSLSDYQTKFYDLSEIIQGHSVMDLLWDTHQNLWLATEGNGLIRLSFDAFNQISDTLRINSTSSRQEDHFHGDMVYSLYEDSKDNIWAGTTDGLFRIQKTSLNSTHYSILNGLPDNYVASVTGDEKGNIWISHKKGISKLKNTSDTILNYSILDNKEAWVFMDKSVFNDERSHTIYFGSRNGYVSFHPVEIEVNPYRPKVMLKNLYLAGERVAPDNSDNKDVVLSQALSQIKTLNLNYANRNFALEIAALHYENPGDIQLFYQLTGYTNGWMQTRQSQISFTRVPPGQYVFMAKAVSSDNITSKILSLPIVIKPPWYYSTLAILSYFLLFVFLLLLVFRFILYRERLRNALDLERIKVEKQEELNQQKLEFFTNVSHDLRTPLTLITDPIKQLQKDDYDKKKRAEYLSLISRNVDRLTDLINQLLDFRKAETGKLLANFSIEDVVEIFRESLQPFSLKASKRNIVLQFNTDISECVGKVDKEKLKLILTNLISNALKYTQDKGEVSVELSFQEQVNQVKLCVVDNGVGIERKALKKIFEPFNNEGAKPFYGYSSGMGLALTHKLVQILGGIISIESAPQKGTTVTVNLPFQKADRRIAINEQAASEEMNEQAPKSKKDKIPMLLIVEDNTDVQSYLKTELDGSYDIIIENNGLNGLKTTLKKVPDLIISDVMMPKMDGITFCEKVKSNEHSSHIPVILLTAKTSEESQVEGLSIGADSYVAKPFSIDVLKAQIKSLLENRSRLQTHLSQAKYVSELSKGENKQDNSFVKKLINIINEQVENPDLNPDFLAEELGMSRRQLYRKLEAVSGSTVQDFIVRVRMEKASDLLLNTNLNVSQVADKLGFSEASNFTRRFSKHFGKSPTKFRKEHIS